MYARRRPASFPKQRRAVLGRSGSRIGALVFLLLAVALVAACSGASSKPTPTVESGAIAQATVQPTVTGTPPPTATLQPATPIVWNSCSAFQCASFNVPLDYADPSRATISLSLIRQPARDEANRIGTLFVNPGGPGGSAIEFMRYWAPLVDRDVRNRFDIVAFDPRGVGQSSPINCHDNLQQIIALPADPQTDADWQKIIDANKALADQCEKTAGAVLPFLGTASVARDMDRIREALGEDKITYVGYSYGTEIGQVYADLFPGHVRAMVLDGNVDIAEDTDKANLDQTVALEAAINRYISDCRATSCLPRDPRDAIDSLLATAAKAPIPAPAADRPLSESEVLYALVGSMYSPAQAPALTSAISQALNGNGSRMIRIVDDYLDRQGTNGPYSNLFESNLAVNCLDSVYSRDPQHYRALVPEFKKTAPLLGSWSAQSGIACAVWPVEPKPLPEPRATGAPPILLIGNTGDPATPYKWSVAVSKEIASATLLTYDGSGHTAYMLALNNCINSAVDSYLVDLKVPPKGMVCGGADITPVPAPAP